MGRGRSLKKIGYTSCCILLLLVSKVVPQDSRQFIGRNLCAERTNGTTTDNLSCLDNNECFPRAQLCDGVNNCVDGSDEGIGNAAIICKLFLHYIMPLLLFFMLNSRRIFLSFIRAPQWEEMSPNLDYVPSMAIGL